MISGLNNSSTYFASDKPEALASELMDRSKGFYQTMKANLYLTKMAACWRFYHGIFAAGFNTDHQVSFTGEQGELVNLPVNHFRNIARHMYVMITSNRPSMEARAINTDAKSLAQATLANGILEYYMREKGLEEALKLAVEMSIVLGAAFIKMEWNATGGEPYDFDPETGEYNYEGEIEFSNLSPFDVVFDGTKNTWTNDWILTRTFKNRFDLAAKYPELKDKILDLPNKASIDIYRLSLWSNDKTDDIPVYEFFHKRTEALPEGRYLLFLSDDIILLDTPIPYRTLPVFRIAPENYIGTPYGYTSMFDIYPIQECINSLSSAMMSNQEATAVQSFYIPKGADLDISNLEGGMTIMEGNSKPEAINLEGTADSTFKMLDLMIQTAETLSGVSSVTRGNPEASLKSGTALALVQSMSLQFISGLQQSYVSLIEDVGTALVVYLKDFAKAPRVAAIVGKSNKTYLKEFTGDDLDSINRVIVDVGNPLARSTAGRVQMAEQLLQMKLLKNPDQYFQIINTGKLEVAYEGEQHELLLIKQENEQLMVGNSPVVSPLDKHRVHINEHKAVMADPDIRLNPELRGAVMEHIQKHLDALRTVDPALLQMIGEEPLPPIGMPMGGEQQQQAAPPNSSTQGMMQPPSLNLPSNEQAMQEAGLPPLPKPAAPFENMPVLPEQMPTQ